MSCTGLGVRVNCVPMQETPPEDIIGLASLAKDRELDIRFIEMMPIGLGKNFGMISGSWIRDLLEERFGIAGLCSENGGNGPAVYVRFPGFKGRIGFIDALSHQFCGTCNRVRLTSEGYLKSCLQYETGVDLRRLLRNGAEDEELRTEMYKAIHEKPACHQFAGKGEACGSGGQILETRDMSQIGG